MRPHQGSVEGKENLPRPAGHTLLEAEEEKITGFILTVEVYKLRRVAK